MLKHEAESHWGRWVWGRALAVGLRSRVRLASEVGCNAERVGHWLALGSPPARMHAKYDARLASALRVTPMQLFTNFADLDPATLAPLALAAMEPGPAAA